MARKYKPRSEASKAKNAAYQLEYSRKNREEILRKQREVYAANKEAGQERTAQWRRDNPEKVKAQADRSTERYRTDEEYRKRRLAYGRPNNAALCAKRVAAKLNRTPPWANLKRIERVYMLAAWASKFTDEPLHVDYIIPLRGKNISGLHVYENLQILPAQDNIVKSNTWNA